MKKEQIQEYTLRISNANRTGIITVLFDALGTYVKEGMDAEGYDRLKDSLRNATRIVYELEGALDMDREISANLWQIYDFWGRFLEMAIIKNSKEGLDRIYDMIISMADTFRELEKKDDSPVLMKNAEQVYAGLTYGRDDVNTYGETSLGGRGFFV